MTKEQLQERISKLEVKIEKEIKNRNKYLNRLSNNFKEYTDINHYKWKDIEEMNLKFSSYDEKYAFEDCRRKNINISDYTTTLNKYKNQLKALSDLVDLPALKEFLNNWKEEAINYYTALVDSYIQHRKEIEEEYTKKGTITNGCIYYNSPFKAEYHEKCEALKKAYGSYILNIVNYYSSTRYEKIKEDMEKEAQAKYKKLVNRISGIVGEINDCSHLSIKNGEINGIISGNKGKASINTVVAGGYNENVIVNVKHGQCLHYRVLVKEYK